jgi:hypothetical protein
MTLRDLLSSSASSVAMAVHTSIAGIAIAKFYESIKWEINWYRIY